MFFLENTNGWEFILDLEVIEGSGEGEIIPDENKGYEIGKMKMRKAE